MRNFITVFAFVFWLMISLLAVYGRQAEAPPIKDECIWMYQKALDAALDMDKSSYIRNFDGKYSTGESHYYAIEVANTWASMYVACKTRTRR